MKKLSLNDFKSEVIETSKVKMISGGATILDGQYDDYIGADGNFYWNDGAWFQACPCENGNYGDHCCDY